MTIDLGRATEQSVGCHCFVTPGSSLKGGIIKHRYTDFQVHEIDLAGSIVRLTSRDPLPLPAYPPGYEVWLESSSPFFEFVPDSDLQAARVYCEQPTLNVSVKADCVSLERIRKRRRRPIITTFVLYKENMSVQEAIGRIASSLRVPKKLIGYAGNKDKRGVTTQLLTIRDVTVERLQEVAPGLGPNLRIGMSRPSINPLSLGDLTGNRFAIVLRDIKGTGIENVIAERVEAVKQSGFLNYFGMQRFGNGTVPTHMIGVLILKGEWLRICQLLLDPDKDEQEPVRTAKQIYRDTKDPREALKRLPKSAQIEKALFEHMARSPSPADHFKDPHKLFSKVDRRQRMLYVHAYQSYLWNQLVSSRWRQSGGRLVVGDVVRDANGELVTVSDLTIGQYSVFDVILPLPIVDAGSTAARLMEADGVTPQMFRKLAGEYGATGDWRPMLGRAQDLQWALIRHGGMDDQLLDTDWDKMNDVANQVNWTEHGQILSLLLEFSLGGGQYATMLVREILKRSTESDTDSGISKKLRERNLSWWQRICSVA
jgi:tRNA pseudouridine13 synthase